MGAGGDSTADLFVTPDCTVSIRHHASEPIENYKDLDGSEEGNARTTTAEDGQIDTDVDKYDVDWSVQYGAGNYEDIETRTMINVHGLRLILINDKENVFYPILYANIDRVGLVLDNTVAEADGPEPSKSCLAGETELRAMVSYYNNRIEVWEPFLEAVTVNLQVSKEAGEILVLASFKSPLKINVTEELGESLLQAYVDLQKIQRQEELRALTQARLSERRRMTQFEALSRRNTHRLT